MGHSLDCLPQPGYIQDCAARLAARWRAAPAVLLQLVPAHELEVIAGDLLVARGLGGDLEDPVDDHPGGGKGQGQRISVQIHQLIDAQGMGDLLGVAFGIDDLSGAENHSQAGL